MDSETQETRSRQRYARLRMAVVFSVASKLVRAVSQTILIGLSVRHLGTETYGLWLAAVAALGWLGWGQAGLAPGLANALATAEGEERYELQGVYFTTAMTLIGLICLGLFLFGQSALQIGGPMLGRLISGEAGITTPQADWGAFLQIGLGLALLRLPLGLVESAYVGLQVVHVLRIWDMVGQAFAVLAALLLVLASTSSAIFLLGIGVAAECGVVGACLFLILRFRPQLRPSPEKFNMRASRRMFNLSVGYLAIQVTGYLVAQAGTVILAAHQGPASVPQFAMTWQLYMMASGIWMMFVTGLWGALGEARARGEWAWIQKAQTRLVLGSMACSVAFSLLLAVGGNVLLRIWSGGRVQADALFLVIMALNCSIFTWAVLHAQILSALNLVWKQIWASAANAVLTVVLAFALIPSMGATGLALALALSCLATTAWIFPLMLARNTQGGHPCHGVDF